MSQPVRPYLPRLVLLRLDRLAKGLDPDFKSVPAHREGYEDEWERCAGDIVYWCNTYVKTYDPRLLEDGLNPNVPFHLYPFQEEYLHWLQDRLDGKEHGLVEKSRDMGATWLNVVFDTHHWLFTPGYKAGIGSRKEQLVDRLGDMDAIFPKFRHILDNLPAWMLPAGFAVGGQYDNYMRLENPENGAAITGESGDNIGRGGRNTRYTIDEHAFLQHPDLVEKAVSQNTNCVIYTSTPNGSGNLFATKRHSGKVKVFTMHWTRHPKKDKAWYNKMCGQLDAVTVAQEIDIDYTASVEGICIPGKWVRAGVEFYEWIKSQDEDFAAAMLDGPRWAGLDVGESVDLSVYTFTEGVVTTRVEHWSGVNTTQTARKAARYAEEDEAEILKFDPLFGGVAGTLEESEKELGKKYPFKYKGINVGLPASKLRYRDAPKKKADERFANLKMELWWNLRLRFEACYEMREGIKDHKAEDLISIPNHPDLIRQLSQPKLEESARGKVILESKQKLKKRGISSPDFAESLTLCFCESMGGFVLHFAGQTKK